MCIVDMRTVFANAKVNITKRNVPNVTCGKPKLVRRGRKCYTNPLIQGRKIETGERTYGARKAGVNFVTENHGAKP
jgi:hypothetical protein